MSGAGFVVVRLAEFDTQRVSWAQGGDFAVAAWRRGHTAPGEGVAPVRSELETQNLRLWGSVAGFLLSPSAIPCQTGREAWPPELWKKLRDVFSFAHDGDVQISACKMILCCCCRRQMQLYPYGPRIPCFPPDSLPDTGGSCCVTPGSFP